MRRLTHAIVVAGAVLCAHTSTATVIVCDPSTTDCPSPPPTTGSLNCEGAALSQGVIWPPDHKMVPLNIIDLPSDPNLVVMPVTVQISTGGA